MTAVIIAPGGAYQRLAMNLEGRAPANYFNALGIAAFVLRYRLGPSPRPRSPRNPRRIPSPTPGVLLIGLRLGNGRGWCELPLAAGRWDV